MHPADESFNSGVVSPMQCLREGWQLLKGNYWLFVGITFVGVFIGSMGPMGLLMGPMVCGIHLCLFRQERGLPVSFNMLFKGFDYFLQSFVATLITFVPNMVIGMILYFSLYLTCFGGMFTIMGVNPPPNARNPPDPAIGITMLVVGGAISMVAMVVALILRALFTFIYPLIVDRQLTGPEAVKLSVRAAWANFGGVVTLMILEILLSFLGFLMFYVGIILILPLGMAMITVAYRQVFPEVTYRRRFVDDDDDDFRSYEDDDGEPRRMSSRDTDIQASRFEGGK